MHFRELKCDKHHNIRLQRSYNKYGGENFVWEIVNVCHKDKCLDNEQYCLDFYKPDYNMSLSASSPMKGRKHTEETKKRMSEKRKGNKYRLGIKMSKEEKLVRSKARTGFKWSEKVKKKMSATAKRVNSIGRIDRTKQQKKLTDNKGNEFESLSAAAKFWNKPVSTICDYLKGRTKNPKDGIRFEYLEEE